MNENDLENEQKDKFNNVSVKIFSCGIAKAICPKDLGFTVLIDKLFLLEVDNEGVPKVFDPNFRKAQKLLKVKGATCEVENKPPEKYNI